MFFLIDTIYMYSQYNTLSDHPHIPQQAFLYQPHHTEDQSQNDDYRIGSGKKIRRLLFEGWAESTYTQYQLQKLQEFDNYLKRKGIILDERWDRSWRMRFLLSVGCDHQKCIEHMGIYLKHIDSVQELHLNEIVSKYLREGVFYVGGRDSHYRPILVFDVDKIMKLKMTEDELLETMTYFFQYIMRHFLIPGQVQNWVAIIDVAETGLLSLIGTLKKSFSFLSDTYRSRMFACYVCRIPSSLSILWGIVKRFLEEETVNKINFFDEQAIPPLLQYCNPQQLQKKFGGALPNISQGHFWPSKQVNHNYRMPTHPTTLMTRQQYTQHYYKKNLYNTKFHPQNIIKPSSGQITENHNLSTLRHMDRDFKIMMETSQEDAFNQDQDVKPFTRLKATLNYFDLIRKDELARSAALRK